MLKAIVYILIVIFIVIASAIIVPLPVFIKRRLFPFMAISSIAFFLLGLTLIFLTLKRKVKGKLKKFLILTGVSSSGFLVSVLLHNILYGFGVMTKHIILLSSLMEVLHVVFFIIAIFVCPIGFLIGVIGSLVLFIRKRKRR